jgi:hypothetical protein
MSRSTYYGGQGGSGTVDAVARANVKKIAANPGTAIAPNDSTFLVNSLWTNNTAAAINVPGTITPVNMLATGFTKGAASTNDSNIKTGGGNPTTNTTGPGVYYLNLTAAQGENNIWGPSIADGSWPAQADFKSFNNGLYSSDGSIPPATARSVTIPTDSSLTVGPSATGSQLILDQANAKASLTGELGGNSGSLSAGKTGVQMDFSGVSDLKINGSAGLTGQVPLSAGPGLPPTWGAAPSPTEIHEEVVLSANTDLDVLTADIAVWPNGHVTSFVTQNTAVTLSYTGNLAFEIDGSTGTVTATPQIIPAKTNGVIGKLSNGDYYLSYQIDSEGLKKLGSLPAAITNSGVYTADGVNTTSSLPPATGSQDRVFVTTTSTHGNAIIHPQAGEQLNDVTDGTYTTSLDNEITLFIDNEAGKWIYQSLGKATEPSGLYKGSATTLAAIPSGKNGDWGILTIKDGSNVAGIWETDGTTYTLKKEIKDLAQHASWTPLKEHEQGIQYRITLPASAPPPYDDATLIGQPYIAIPNSLRPDTIATFDATELSNWTILNQFAETGNTFRRATAALVNLDTVEGDTDKEIFQEFIPSGISASYIKSADPTLITLDNNTSGQVIRTDIALTSSQFDVTGPATIRYTKSATNFHFVIVGFAPPFTVSKNEAAFPVGDATLKYFQDDPTGPINGEYYPLLDVAADIIFPALENGRRIVFGFNWTARAVVNPPPTYTTQGATGLLLPGGNFPSSGQELIIATADIANDRFVISTSGAGTLTGTVPLDSVGYPELKPSLKGTVELGATNNIDWSQGVVFGRNELTSAATFTFSNVIENKTVSLLLKGVFSITFPASVDVSQLVNYNGLKWNKIQFESNVTAGVTLIWATLITQG